MAVCMNRGFCSLKSQNHYDYIISGGGMVGATLAAALGRAPLLRGKTVLLLEGAAPAGAAVGSRPRSNRVSALNPASKRLMQSVGMWRHIEATRCRPVGEIRVWGEYSHLNTSFASQEDLAYVVENDLIVESATQIIEESDNVTIEYRSKVKEVGLDGLPWIRLEDGTKKTCNLLIGADGANSLIRKTLEFPNLTYDYKQMGVVATVTVGVDGGNRTAWQRFLRKGPVALLPLDDTTSSVVWSTSRDEASVLMSLPEEAFVDALNSAFNSSPKTDPLVSSLQEGLTSLLTSLSMAPLRKDLMPPYVSSIAPGSRAAFPLGFSHCPRYASHPHVCLVGDSAHRVHPLAGQGVNLGLHDVALLVSTLSQAARDGCAHAGLGVYERQALAHNVPVMAAIQLFHSLFVTELPLLKAIGNSSFLLADSLPPVKQIMRQLASN